MNSYFKSSTRHRVISPNHKQIPYTESFISILFVVVAPTDVAVVVGVVGGALVGVVLAKSNTEWYLRVKRFCVLHNVNTSRLNAVNMLNKNKKRRE